MATSKWTYSNMHLQGLLLPVPLLLRQATANLRLKHSQVDLAQCSVGSLLLSPGFWCTQGFVCALQEWSLCPDQRDGVTESRRKGRGGPRAEPSLPLQHR